MSNGTVTATTWNKRIKLVVPPAQAKKLSKGKRALIMKDKQLYEITRKADPRVFDSKGKLLTLTDIKALLRKL